jgi:hypothetical protein
MKPNPKEINIILNILKGAPFYIDMPLVRLEPFDPFHSVVFIVFLKRISCEHIHYPVF